MTLVSVTAYHSFSGEVEALNTPTIRRLTPSCRHQLSRIAQLLRETARAHDIVIHAGAVNRDPIHMLLSIPPSLSVSRAVQHLKGRSSHKLLSEFGILRKRYWGQHLWARGYWVASSGNVTDEVWMEYIKNQAPPEPDDNFKVT
jgi:putative transposase